jgi:hypothetical protein
VGKLFQEPFHSSDQLDHFTSPSRFSIKSRDLKLSILTQGTEEQMISGKELESRDQTEQNQLECSK